MEPNTPNPKGGPPIKALICTGLFILLAWVCWFGWTWSGGPKSLSEKGQFGDSFGALNTLFSGLTVAGVIYSLLVQRAELKSQEREAISARETQSLQNAAIAAQLNTMERSLALQQEMAEVGSRPLLLLQNINKHDRFTGLTLRNYGAVFFEPKVDSSEAHDGCSISVKPPPGIEFREGADFPLGIEWTGPAMPPRVLIVLSYTNKHGYRGRYEVLLSEGHDVIERSRVVGLTE